MKSARILSLFLAAASVACSPQSGEMEDRQSARVSALDNTLTEISESFHAICGPLSEFSGDCHSQSESRPLEAYFDAIASRRANAATRAILNLHEGLACYASADFDNFLRAFAESALGRDKTRDYRSKQDLSLALAPIVFVLMDSPRARPDDLHMRYQDWLDANFQSLMLGMHGADKFFPNVGFVTRWDDDLIQIPVDKGMLLMEGLAAGDVSLLDCDVQNMVALNEGERLRLACPSDCPVFDELLSSLTAEERAELRASLPEYSAFCADVKEALNAGAGIRPGVLDCVREYVDDTGSGVACVAENLAGRRGADTMFERVRNLRNSHSLELIRNQRVCQLSDMTSQEREEYEDLTDRRNKIVQTIHRNKDQIADNEQQIRDYQRRAANPVGILPPNPFAPAAIRSLQAQNRQLEQQNQRLTDSLRDTAPRWNELNRKYQNSGTRNCPPGVDGCADECGLGTDVLDPFRQCVFQEPTELPDPGDPVSRPDPRDPPVANDGALGLLRQCISTVIEENRPPNQASCPATVRCDDPTSTSGDTLLLPDTPPGVRCTCLKDVPRTDGRNRRLCDWIAKPNPATGQFSCPSLGEDRSDEVDGTLGGPDPEVFMEVLIGSGRVGR